MSWTGPSSRATAAQRVFALCALALVVTLSAATPARANAQHSRERSQERLKAQVLKEVERTLPASMVVRAISLPPSLARHSSTSDMVSLEWRRAPTRGRTIVQVLIHKSSGRITKGWARVELAELRKILVAAVDLKPGSILVLGDVRVEQRPLVSASELQVEPAYIVGSRVVLARSAGEALRKSDLSMPLPVARGSRVRVVVRRAGLVVATTGVLETKTRVGRSTRVRVAGKILVGKLTRSDLVELGDLR